MKLGRWRAAELVMKERVERKGGKKRDGPRRCDVDPRASAAVVVALAPFVLHARTKDKTQKRRPSSSGEIGKSYNLLKKNKDEGKKKTTNQQANK